MDTSNLLDPKPWLIRALHGETSAIPPRIQAMIDKLIANADTICQTSVGSVELHYKDATLRVKITQHL